MLATSAKAETEEITNAVQAPGYRAGITDAVAERCRVLDRDGGGAARDHPAVAIDPDAAGNDPVSTMPPLRKVLLLTEMPPGPMVPALLTPPLKVVWLTTKASVLPLNVVGKGPVKPSAPPM